MSITIEQPPRVVEHHDDSVCLVQWVEDTSEVREAARGLIDAFRQTEPIVVFVDQTRATVIVATKSELGWPT